jgi:hypothetical protein
MAKTKEELVSMIETELVDPTTNKITGERVKNALTEMVDAMGTGGGGGAMEYWTTGQMDMDTFASLAMFLPWAKFSYVGSTFITSTATIAAFAGDNASSVTLMAFAVDMNAKVRISYLASGQVVSVREAFSMMEMPEGGFAEMGCTPLTEEEFYTIS